jgi:hypothetical protein
MARREKLVQKWLNDPPTDAPIDEVDAVLRYFFRGKILKKSGSHRVIRDARLKGFSGFEPYGEFAISVTGGQRVKGYLLHQLAQAIMIIEEIGRDLV